MKDEYGIPFGPWLRLEDAEAAILRHGLVSLEFVTGDDGVEYVSGDTSIALSKFFSDAAFAEILKLMGRPARPHEGTSSHEIQAIPSVYFRKQRSFYGSSGVGRLPFEPTSADLAQDIIDAKSATAEGDWIEVLVDSSGIVALVKSRLEGRSRSGGPGRPTSMHLVEHEFQRRMRLGLAADTNTKESEFLASWLKNTHEGEPRLTPKAIRNRLGPIRRNMVAARN